MEIFNINDRILYRVIFPLVAVGLVFGYFFLRKVIVGFLELFKRVKTQKKVGELRQAGQQQKPVPVIARRTDLVSQLSSVQKKQCQFAEQLLAHKRILEAAKIFESIQFQRKAIDILEQNGYLDEAVAILMRMNLPQRAAVLYERNHRFQKAAEFYLLAEKKDAAAKNFEKLAQQDYHFYRSAGDCYYQAGMVDNCLAAYSKLLLSDEVLKICLATQKYEYLQHYMMIPFNARYLLPHLKPAQFSEMVESLALTPSLMLAFALWLAILPEAWLLVPCLRKSAADEECARLLWSLLSPDICHKICHVFAKNPQQLTSDEYRVHGHALIYQKKIQFGEYFVKLMPFGGSLKSGDRTQASKAS
ncbi:MAG: hypothetical protein ACOH5I_22485 [Oligoflexus sp.]